MINVYRASAGAGKTHKLAGEYIKLLFKKPYAYKHILAVTFTNKATDEMKQRILQELYTLSLSNSKSDYLVELCDLYKKDEYWVRGEARRILVAILNDYSSFAISTIDKFFQTVMRAFARELGKIATYNVELDSDSVLSNSIDRMFSELDKPENKSLLKWLIAYSLDAIDAGNSWDIRKEIFDLSKELFSEDFKLKKRDDKEVCVEQGESAVEREKILMLKNRVRNIKIEFEKTIILLGNKGLKYMELCGLTPTNFRKGAYSSFNYFKTLSQPVAAGKVIPLKDSFISLYNNIDLWYTGKKLPPAIEDVYNRGLNDCIGEVINYFQKEFKSYSTAQVIAKNINALGILDDIYRRVLAYCKEKNIILLSESTELLNRIIDGSDTPFIYEKIGTRIDNFMLDEFQDTSTLQWRNFYPLLQNSIAMGNDNLIVGDVKQSIYRWRGSDWQILNNELFNEFCKDEITSASLDCNWRSGKNIVEFNNGFFRYCAQIAQKLYDGNANEESKKGLIEDVYSNFEQQVSNNGKENPGYLEVNFVTAGDDGFSADVLADLPLRINKLIDNGLRQRDIALLVRTRGEGRNVAQTLITAGYDVISNDSLFICSSLAVQKVVNILRELENPNNLSLKVYRHFSLETIKTDISYKDNLAGMSLYQMCEEIIRCYLEPYEKEDIAFLQSFLDSVLEYTNREGTNLSQFIKWWDDCGQTKTISAPQDQDAINVMTIHKSKGLGFKCVIIPFFKEKLDHIGGRLWCNIKDFEDPIPVVYNSFLLNTEFWEDYYREKLYTYVDNLNTAYVAFTRSKDELIIYSPVPKFNKDGSFPITSVSDILYKYYDVKQSGEGINRIYIGEIVNSAIKKEDAIGKEMFSAVFNEPLDYSRTKTSLNSGSINEGTSIREYGIAMHYVFSLINTVDDVENAVSKAFREGICECSAVDLAKMIVCKLKFIEQYGWFNGSYTVMNECDIVKQDGNVARPDRVLIKNGCAVVVDYKFGEQGEEDGLGQKYIRQIKGYMLLLTQMGYQNVKGYIWYIKNDLVVEC